MPVEIPELVVPDAEAWAAWLTEHHEQPDGVWLLLGKADSIEPTSLRRSEALEEALCYGWIDGQGRSRDETTWYVRFTPRRARSPWSQINVGIVARLTAAGRMRPAGLAAVEAAQADGRWEAAYAGPATAVVPGDLASAISASPLASERFGQLNRTNRYALILRVGQAKRAETRARRIAQFVEMLEQGRAPYPQKGFSTGT